MRSSIKVNTNKDLLLLRNNILGMKMVLSVYFQSVLNLETHTVIFVNEKLLPLKFASKYLEANFKGSNFSFGRKKGEWSYGHCR